SHIFTWLARRMSDRREEPSDLVDAHWNEPNLDEGDGATNQEQHMDTEGNDGQAEGKEDEEGEEGEEDKENEEGEEGEETRRTKRNAGAYPLLTGS
ncbi:collagen triple helix repeat protein, partial [Planoprotostelium fungivorum]